MSNLPHFNDPNIEDYCCGLSSAPNDSQQTHQETCAAQPQPLMEKDIVDGLKLPSTSEVKMSERHRRVKQLLVEKVSAVEGSAGVEGSAAKKLDHNAKERMRRMRLNASYLALRALLPDSRRSKKRWTAPAVVDRVLKYIPELENEIEILKHTKDEAKNKKQQSLNEEPQSLTVSVNEVQSNEAIVQICTERHRNEVFPMFLENMEAQGICIKIASTLSICQNRICYQLHIEWDATLHGADYVRKLRDEVTRWLS